MRIRWRREGIQIKKAFKANVIICPWCARIKKYETESLNSMEEGAFNWQFFICDECGKKFKTFRWRNVFYNKRVNKF